MGYFPLCVDLKGKRVLLVGDGPQIADKIEKLRPFGAVLVRCETITPEMLDQQTAFVVVGDTSFDIAKQISSLCASKHIPVNVVDRPSLSTFFFPALISRGDVTVSVSTGGKSPGTAAYLAGKIGQQIPSDLGQIVDQLQALRKQLYASYPKETARRLLREAAERAFED